MTAQTRRKIVALSGGVGGAKLARGFQLALEDPADLTVVVNTGDDFEHLGLKICPDIDSVTYSLADLDDRERGWGRRAESWQFLEALQDVGAETWFQLGDKDLALHVERTRRLRAGERLTNVTAELSQHLGAKARILPMSDDPVATIVVTDQGDTAFQEYFVRLRCAPELRAVRFQGAAEARPAPGVLEAMSAPDLAAIVVCPSNPYLSVDPILAVPALREALISTPAPVIAVSPIVGGRAIKGPTAKIMGELGVSVDPVAIAAHYGEVLDAFVIDESDKKYCNEIEKIGLRCFAENTMMVDDCAKANLARGILDIVVGEDWSKT